MKWEHWHECLGSAARRIDVAGVCAGNFIGLIWFAGRINWSSGKYFLKSLCIFSVPQCGICISQCEICIPHCGFCIPQCETENLSWRLKENYLGLNIFNAFVMILLAFRVKQLLYRIDVCKRLLFVFQSLITFFYWTLTATKTSHRCIFIFCISLVKG